MLIGEIIGLIEKGVDLRRYYIAGKANEIDRFISPSENVKTNINVYEFLAELYYDVDVLIGPNGPFPMGIIDIPLNAKEQPEDILGRIVTKEKQYAVLEPKIIAAIKRRGSTIWNGTTFSLDELVLNYNNEATEIKAHLGSYYDMVSSADYLEYECIAAMETSALVGLDQLSARSRCITKYNSPLDCLLHGGGVDAVIAISTLVVYLHEDQYWLLCDVRSKMVAEYGDLYHVIPSFIFQPVTNTSKHNLKVEWSIKHNIFREYLEELFNVPEVKRAGRPVAPDFFYGHPNLRLLQEYLRTGSAQLRGVAFAFNLLTHRPEILTLLLIQDESWFDQQKDCWKAKAGGLVYLNLNEEFLGIESRTSDQHLEIITALPLQDSYWENIVKPWLMVPPGAPALIMGAKEAVCILGLEEPEWLKKYGRRKSRQTPFD